MRTLHTFAAALTIVSVGVTGAAAQGKGNSGAPKAPKAPTTTVSHGNAGGGSTHGSAPAQGPGSSHAPASGTTQSSNTATTGGHGGDAGKGHKTTTVTAHTFPEQSEPSVITPRASPE